LRASSTVVTIHPSYRKGGRLGLQIGGNWRKEKVEKYVTHKRYVFIGEEVLGKGNNINVCKETKGEVGCIGKRGRDVYIYDREPENVEDNDNTKVKYMSKNVL